MGFEESLFKLFDGYSLPEIPPYSELQSHSPFISLLPDSHVKHLVLSSEQS